VVEALDTFGVPYLVIETDPDVITNLRSRGVPCFFGDAAHARILDLAGANAAALVVLALPQADRVRQAIRHIRTINPTAPILARAHERAAGDDLRTVGATEVIQPELEAAAGLIREALKHLELPEQQSATYLDRFREALEAAEPRDATGRGPFPQVVEVVLPSGTLADQSLREARLRERFGVTVVAIARTDGELVINPSPEAILRPGDRVRLFGLPGQIEAFVSEAHRQG